MVKSYLRYVPGGVHGVITSPAGNVAVDATGSFVFTPQLECVGMWNVKKGVQVTALAAPAPVGPHQHDGVAEVTVLATSPSSTAVAAGYQDGTIRVFDYAKAVATMVLHGHRKAVSSLAFSADGLHLVSGSRDTDVIVWDLVAESGLVRLRGHKDEVTGVAVVEGIGRPALLVTCSKDTTIKAWDMRTFTCLQTIVGARVELWSLAAVAAKVVEGEGDGPTATAGARVYVGGGDNLLRVYAVNPEWGTGTAVGDGGVEVGDAPSLAGGAGETLVLLGHIVRQTHERTAHVAVSMDGGLMAVQAAGKLVEVYRRRSGPEVSKRVVRRLRRAREKLRQRERAAAAASTTTPATLTPGWGDGEDGGEGGGDVLASPWMVGTTLMQLEAEITRLEADGAGGEGDAGGEGGVSSGLAGRAVIASDELELMAVVSAHTKLNSIAFLPPDHAAGVCNLLVATGDNQMQVYACPLTPLAQTRLGCDTITTSAGISVAQAPLARSFAQQGHRSDVRSVAVSSDGALLMSTSTHAAKLWSAKTGVCMRTMDLGDTVGLTCAFGPANRHALVGCKDGRLCVFDLASGDLVESHTAHDGAVWSIAIRPDGKGAMTGSADKSVKFWDFDVVATGGGGGSGGVAQLTLVHARTLKMGDEVLCVKYSHHTEPTELLVAAALLDSTVKVFFDDTLRFFLSLYGHKLPVMAMDISADNTLLVTASADKNVKLWGLDYGDCHKSFFAHADSIMAVAFLSRTHYFFTASKDKTIKYWDGDRFEHILTLSGHHKGEVWALAAAADGSFLVTGSHDRSLRLWRRSEEQVFLEEEREKEMEATMERALRDGDGDDVVDGRGDAIGPIDAATGLARPTDGDTPVTTAPVIGGALSDASLIVARATTDSSRSADRLVEALALAEDEVGKWQEYADDVAAAVAAGDDPTSITPPARNPLLLDLTPAAYILRTLRSIRPSDLDQVLIVLPFSQALQLLRYVHHLLRRGVAVELCAKAALLLLRVHQHQIIATHALMPVMASLQSCLQHAIAEHKDRVGYNAAGLKFLAKMTGRDLEAENGAMAGAGAPAIVAPAKVRAGKRADVAIF